MLVSYWQSLGLEMIFLFQRYIPHYRWPIWDRLSRALKDELVLCYGDPPPDSSHLDASGKTTGIETCKLNNFWISNETAVWQPFLRPFRQYKLPEVVISEHNIRLLSLIPLIVYCRVKKIPIILHGHGGSRKRDVVHSTSLVDVYHRWLVRICDAYICYTDNIKEQLSNFVSREKLFVARNTLDTNTLFDLLRELEVIGKYKIRERLKLNSEYYVVFIGRLIPEKEVDFLLDVMRILQDDGIKIGLLIIGNGPERENLEKYAHKKLIKDVNFLGAMAEWEASAPYIFAADLMVIPGYVGLAVNHSLCFGLPVITQLAGPNGPFHSPEIEFIRHGETGLMVKNGDNLAMAESILSILENLAHFREKTTSFAEEYLTIDILVSGIISAIRYVEAETHQSVTRK